MPCFNSEATLAEAVNSCFTGELKDFEIVMVDDGSKDSTRTLMETFAKNHPEIRTVYHSKNRGGGAARNTGIQEAKGKLIFCLDSDNILDAASLQKMVAFLEQKQADGVIFYERRFFHSQRKKSFTKHFNTILDAPITLDNIFDDNGILLDNFLYTKESFLKTKQYPEHHGFDTQSFEMRYLSTDNKVYVCPDTFFYHRQNNKEPSYFEREFNKGNFSVNYFLAIEDIWHLLTHKAKQEILAYDIFLHSNLQENILDLLKKIHKNNYLFKKGNQEETQKEESYSYDSFLISYRNGDYATAVDICKTSFEKGVDSKIIYFGILRACVGLSIENPVDIEKKTSEILSGLITRPKTLNKWHHRNIFTLTLIQFINTIWKK